MVWAYQTHGTGVAVAVDPVGAVVCVEVLAPVLVETAAARHGEDMPSIVDVGGVGW